MEKGKDLPSACQDFIILFFFTIIYYHPQLKDSCFK